MASKLIDLNQVPITSMAFNFDCSKLVVGLSNTNAEVYDFNPTSRKWIKTAVLKDHISRVTGVDWAPNTNKIVTCGADRNAYIWEFDGQNWKSELVLLRISRAATTVFWSPNEMKFAVGSSQRLLTICYYEDKQGFMKNWVSKHIKKPIKSTINSLSWPGSVLIAAGSTDMTVRVFSSYLKQIEEKPEQTCWGTRMPFGQLMQEFQLTSWCSNVSFDASGNYIAIAGHDSSLSIAQGGVPELTVYRGKNLPFNDLEWISGNQIVAVGHDKCPYMFEINEQGLKLLGKHLGKNQTASGFSPMRRFQGMDLRGQTESNSVNTCHTAPIHGLRASDGEKGALKSFVTFGGDGLMFLWPWNNLKSTLTN